MQYYNARRMRIAKRNSIKFFVIRSLDVGIALLRAYAFHPPIKLKLRCEKAHLHAFCPYGRLGDALQKVVMNTGK